MAAKQCQAIQRRIQHATDQKHRIYNHFSAELQERGRIARLFRISELEQMVRAVCRAFELTVSGRSFGFARGPGLFRHGLALVGCEFGEALGDFGQAALEAAQPSEGDGCGVFGRGHGAIIAL